MSRPIRVQFPGAVYHIMSRGNGGHKIFLDKKDYQNFLLVFSEVLERYNWICYAYCLMPNHYHILIETPDPNLSDGMRQLNGKYTQKFNIDHKRFGHIFQGRFKSLIVDMENYRHQIVRYIALNPVRAKIVRNPNEWQWSSHREMIGTVKKPTKCLHTGNALKLFGHMKADAIKVYKEYLSDKIEDEKLMEEVKGKTILGSVEFVEKIKEYFRKQEEVGEIPVIERFAHRPTLQKHFGKECNIKKERNKLIEKAYNEYGYSLSELGRYLGLHYSAISKILKRDVWNRKKS